MARWLRLCLAASLLATWAQAEQATKFVAVGSCGSVVEDNGFNQMAYEALESARASRGIEFSFVFCVTEEDGWALIDSGHNFFIVLGFESVSRLEPLIRAADLATRGIRFALIDVVVDGLESLPNVEAVLFAEDLGAFVVGALAGAQTATKSIGGVFGMPLVPVVKLRNGFAMGARFTCPECVVHAQDVWSFGDLSSGAAVANYMIDTLDTDVIFAAAGATGIGALHAGAAKGVTVLGVDTDQFLTVFGGFNETSGEPVHEGGRRILSSLIKRLDSAVERIITEQLDGGFEGGKVLNMDFSNEGISLAPCNAACDSIAPETLQRVEQIESQIASGLLSSGTDPVSGDLLLENFYSTGIEGNSWTPVSAFGEVPPPMQSFAADYMAIFPGDTVLFVFGGVTEKEAVSATLWSLNVASMGWRKHTAGNQLLGHGHNLEMSDMGDYPTARAFATFTALKDRAQMVLFGGLSGTTRFNDSWLFSMPQPFVFPFEEWTRLAPTGTEPRARDGHAAAATLAGEDGSSSLFIFGGFGSDDTLRNDLWRLTIAADGTSSWARVCNPCQPGVRRDATLAFHEDAIYLHGGIDPSGQRLRDTWMYHTEEDSWAQLRDAPFTRSKHSAVFMHVKPPSRPVGPAMVVFGGILDTGLQESDKVALSYFLPDSDEWISVASSKPPLEQCDSRFVSELGEMRAKARPATSRSSHAAFHVASGSANSTDKMFVVGGRTVDDRIILDLEMFHPSENDVLEDKRYSAVITGVANALGYINITLGLVLLAWTWLNRRHPVVYSSQVPFLALIVVGAIISSTAILCITVDDQGDVDGLARTGDYEPANRACMVHIWLYATGFCLMFGPAFAKIRRVLKVVIASHKTLKRVRISNASLALSVLTLLLLDLSIILVWEVRDPLRYYRRVTIVDEFGNPLQSTGRCHSENSFTFLALMFSLHLLVLVYGNYISYKARNLSSHFSEGKHLQFALITQFELLAIATPVLAMVNEEPISRTFVMAGVIFLNTGSTLAFIFIPKILSVRHRETLQAVGNAPAPQPEPKPGQRYELPSYYQDTAPRGPLTTDTANSILPSTDRFASPNNLETLPR